KISSSILASRACRSHARWSLRALRATPDLVVIGLQKDDSLPVLPVLRPCHDCLLFRFRQASGASLMPVATSIPPAPPGYPGWARQSKGPSGGEIVRKHARVGERERP